MSYFPKSYGKNLPFFTRARKARKARMAREPFSKRLEAREPFFHRANFNS